MMVNVDTLKVRLIDELWLPKIREVAAILYPKRKKHAKLRFFTLSDGISFNDIMKYESENLILRADTAVWIISDFHKRLRVEIENVGGILEGDILSDTICDTSSQLCTVFPRDIINLDFSTQQSNSVVQRIKAEIICLEKNINLQNQKGVQSFLLLFTSIFDALPVEINPLIQDSNALQMQGWIGLSLSSFPQNISDKSQLEEFLKASVMQICQKYGYQNAAIGALSIDIPDCQDKLFSMAVAVKR